MVKMKRISLVSLFIISTILLSKNDAFTYNGDIFKTGRVRVSLSPNLFAAGRSFLPGYFLVLSSALTYGQESKKSYHFDGSISEEVLRNYLARSITMTEVCVDPRFKIDGEDLTSKDNIRLIKNIDAKLIGRALFRWGGEHILNDPEFFSYAEYVIGEVHKFDPDVIFQAAVFEAVSVNVEEVGIPASAFKAYGLPEHLYLNVRGGFLEAAVSRESGEPQLAIRHYNPDGLLLNEYIAEK